MKKDIGHVNSLRQAYRGRRVLVTGHTGFKGAWLCEWLLKLGAEVHGFALRPPTKPALFTQLRLARRLASHEVGDVRDRAAVAACVARVKPDFVFHLAAQPIVRESYRTPAETFDVNVMGTVNVLEAVRRWALAADLADSRGLKGSVSVVCVTTDKVYENDNSGRAFREGDPLGGSDPYSASKGACEIAVASYRRSFFDGPESRVRVASARAGNVIGGGDWAADRIVPDAMRAFLAGKHLLVRNRKSTRPWQHVLEPLGGYLMLGAALGAGTAGAGGSDPAARAFNFGPDAACVKTVGDLVRELKRHFPAAQVEDRTDPRAPKEALLLQLDSAKAATVLGWAPRWDFGRTIRETARWYAAVAAGEDPRRVTDEQIDDYSKGM